MANEQIPTRDELVAALQESRDEFIATIGAIAPDRLEEGRYEGGWNGRQILAHVAAIEWTYPRLLEIPRHAAATDTGAGAGADPPTRTAQGGIDAYNARQVAKRDGMPVAELMAEFTNNREATIAAVSAADESLLSAPIRSAGGVTGPLAQVIMNVSVGHVRAHARDIAGGSGSST